MESRPSFCRYVHCNHFAIPGPFSVHPHSHRFWQAEYILQGEDRAGVADEVFVLAPGQSLLIPEGMIHRFDFGPSGATIFSVKFECDLEPTAEHIIRMEHSEEAEAVWRALQSLLRIAPGPRSPRGHTVEELIASLVHLFLETIATPAESEPDAMLIRARQLVGNAGGRPVAVAELARQLGYSPQHLRARFLDQAGQTPKQFIDAERGRHIANMIRHSDLSLKAISYATGFPDSQGFSRFVKRIIGVAPSELRTSDNVIDRSPDR